MDAKIVLEELKKAIAAWELVRIYCPNLPPLPLSMREYPLTYAVLRDDGMIECGGEWECNVLDPSVVFMVDRTSPSAPYLRDHDESQERI